MVGIRVPRERKLFSVAQCANVSTGRDRIVGPLSSHLLGVSDSDVRDGPPGLVAPFNARLRVDLGVCIWAEERVEERVDRQCLRRVA